MHVSTQEIRSQAGTLKQKNPALRARDLPQRLRIPEGALVAAGCGEGATRLPGPEFARPVEPLALRVLLRGAAALPIMIFVGNQAAIQIYSGPVRTLKQYGDRFNVIDPGFNLHLFAPGIRSAWVVRKPTADGLVSSLELYDDFEQPLLLAFSRRKPGQQESAQWRTLLWALATPDGAA